MRKVVPFLLMSGLAYAQVPTPNVFPASFQANLKTEMCNENLSKLEKTASQTIAFTGTRAAKGCLLSSKEGDGSVKKALWKAGYDVAVDQFNALGEYYQLWQKVGGSDGFLLQHYYDRVTRNSHVYWIKLTDMKSTMTPSLFRPENQVPLTFTPPNNQLVFNTWSLGQCFDPATVLNSVKVPQGSKAQVLASGCQAIEGSREGVLGAISQLKTYDTVDLQGGSQFNWMGQLKTDPSQLMVFNLQPFEPNPKVMVLSWVSYKVVKP